MALLLNKDDFDSVVYLPEELKGDFDWWKRNILESNNPIRLDSYQRIIYSDASTSVWGASCDEESARRFWSEEERKCHIN